MTDLRSGSCPLCHHHEIIESCPLEGERDPLPLALAHPSSNGLQGKTIERKQAFGRMLAYTCRACGFTQWFVARPEDVPIGPEYNTRLLVGGAAEGAYR